ncbi:hypothetical protein LPJ61_000903 [Coemansia biformis]|uniref:C2H2-type domain-containing protein n=1 Tax=Coemansia biformis TaxID=1286918 RepID=A0A9W8CYM2_9FUNG|nr:hypothetical protein LPJ61_000903 [Coemansia biformis]
MLRRSMDLACFLANAPSLFGEEATPEEAVEPDIVRGTHHGAIRCFGFANGDILSCVRWDSQFHITSTDIIRALVHRFEDIRRPVVNIKKFEEGVFSDLRCLKPGIDARLELPRSEFLELLYKHHCVRTQKKQKVFYWASVPHDMLFRDALERDLKREAMGIEPTTKITKDADPSSLVVIGGVELPLSVPPTLAAHMRAAAPAGADALATAARVSTPLVTTSAAVAARLAAPASDTSAGAAPASSSCADDSDTPTMHPDRTCSPAGSPGPLAASSRRQEGLQPLDGVFEGGASQPSLSEYISGRSALLAGAPPNDSWPGVDFHALHRRAPELHGDYYDYQATPTPHHSPREGAANSQGLLDLLTADPNALITQDNVGDFSAILDELLSGAVQAQGSARDHQGFPLVSQSFSPSLFQQPDLLPHGPPRAADRSASAASMSMESEGALRSTIQPPSAAAVAAAAGAMDSSPSAMSVAKAGYMSLSQTPELVAPQRFDSSGIQPMTIDDLDNILATVSSPGPVPLAGSIGSAAPGFADPSLAGLFPMLGSPAGLAELTAPAMSLGVSQPLALVAADGPKPAEDPRPQWRGQKPGNAPPPRSTRFSRFHPYLKTMARIAHRGSPTILNRYPSTADPNIAAAAVNAMVAKANGGIPPAAQAGPSAYNREQQGGLLAAVTGSASAMAQSGGPDSPMLEVGADASYGSDIEHGNASDGDDISKGKESSSRKSKAGEGDDRRRYACAFAGCTKQFKRHEHLKRHLRTHTGERPYKCPVPGCEKIFARMDNLNQHSRTHVNRKTAARRTSHNPADGTAQQQQQPTLSMAGAGALGSSGAGGMFLIGNQTGAPLLDADGVLPRALVGMGGTAAAAESAAADAFAYGGAAAAGGVDVGGARIPLPTDMELLSREWMIRNLGGQLMQQQQQQSPLPLVQSPMMENNIVSFLRKISKNNRVRVAGGTPLGVGDTSAGRARDEQVPTGYGAGMSIAVGGAIPGGGGGQALADPQLMAVQGGDAGSGFGRLLTIEPNGTAINPIWLASFLAQEQQQQHDQQHQQQSISIQAAAELAPTIGTRPASLKRHHHEDDYGGDGDVVMSGNCSDGSARSPGVSGSDRQGAPVTGGVSANKFVRSGVLSKPHTMPV